MASHTSISLDCGPRVECDALVLTHALAMQIPVDICCHQSNQEATGRVVGLSLESGCNPRERVKHWLVDVCDNNGCIKQLYVRTP